MSGYQLLNLKFIYKKLQLMRECEESQAFFVIRYYLSSDLTLALFLLLCDES